jgi:hypothetical protein
MGLKQYVVLHWPDANEKRTLETFLNESISPYQHIAAVVPAGDMGLRIILEARD